MSGKKTKTTAQRLLALARIELNGCWMWNGTILKNGYGNFRNEHGRAEGPHRVAYRILKGDIPNGYDVCHMCDVRACINPDHLFVGTRLDNMTDAVHKGRMPRGDKGNHPTAKLLPHEVIEIRHAIGSAAIIAEQYGIHPNHVYDIRNGRKWVYL